MVALLEVMRMTHLVFPLGKMHMKMVTLLLRCVNPMCYIHKFVVEVNILVHWPVSTISVMIFCIYKMNVVFGPKLKTVLSFHILNSS